MVQKIVQKMVQKMVQKNSPVHILPYAISNELPERNLLFFSALTTSVEKLSADVIKISSLEENMTRLQRDLVRGIEQKF